MNIRHLLICFTLSLLLNRTLAFKEWWEESNAVQLNKNNFYDIVGKDKFVVVKFYTKWCKYCKIISPEYEKVIEEIKSRNDIVIARLEGSDENKEMLFKYGIGSFPQVVLFYPNDNDIYSVLHSHDRTKDSILKWINDLCEIEKENNFLTVEKTNRKYKTEQVNEEEVNIEDFELFEKENQNELDQIRKIYLNLMIKYQRMNKELKSLNSKLDTKLGIEMNINKSEIQVGDVKISTFGLLLYLLAFIGLLVGLLFCLGFFKK